MEGLIYLLLGGSCPRVDVAARLSAEESSAASATTRRIGDLRGLYGAVSEAMARLDDVEGKVWSYEEMATYIIDGCDQFCRRTKCLWDIHVMENVPQVGNWSSDLSRHLAEQTPGMGLTDEQLNFTGEHERNMPVGGGVAKHMSGPTPGTSPGDGAQYEAFDIPIKVSTTRLPDETVEVQRVTWDELELVPESSMTMRQVDTEYERREGGDPRHWTLDKDGLNVLRVIPPARGDATYPDVDGSWGTMTQTDDATVTVVGSYGILREVEGAFPALGPHGTPTRMHPSENNILIEMARLNRPLRHNDFEIPTAWVKFTMFFGMHRALKKNGAGQDLKLSKHYLERFEMGVLRAKTTLRKVNKEKVLKMGTQGEHQLPFDMGDPQLPYPYGPPGRKIR